MPAYKTPTKPRWDRTATTGVTPLSLAPGSMYVNWADKKIFVGSDAGTPVLFNQWLEDWDNARIYRRGDFTLQGNSTWQALEDISPGFAFNQTQWKQLSTVGATEFDDPVSSDIHDGGVVTFTAPAALLVTEGSGLVMDNTTSIPGVASVQWSGFSLTGFYPSESWSVLAIDAAGAVAQVGFSNWDEEKRRDHIVLAYVLWDTGGTILNVLDGTRRTGGTAETIIDEYESNGGAYRVVGLRPSSVPATLGLQVTEGTVFDMGGLWRTMPKQPNLLHLPATSPLTMQLVDRNGIVTADSMVGDPTQWDNAGTLEAVGTSYTIQYLSALHHFNTIFLQYGHTLYATEQDAFNALVTDYDALLPLIGADEGPAMVVGAVIARGNVTNYDGSRVINAARGREPFVAFAQETNTDSFYLLDGQRKLTGPMDADGNAIMNSDIDGGSF